MGIPNDDPRFGAPLFKDVGTFMGVPASRDLSGAKAAVLGIPFDCGLHPVRLGARLGRPRSGVNRPWCGPTSHRCGRRTCSKHSGWSTAAT